MRPGKHVDGAEVGSGLEGRRPVQSIGAAPTPSGGGLRAGGDEKPLKGVEQRGTFREHWRETGAPSPGKAMGPEAPLPSLSSSVEGPPQAQPFPGTWWRDRGNGGAGGRAGTEAGVAFSITFSTLSE